MVGERRSVANARCTSPSNASNVGVRASIKWVNHSGGACCGVEAGAKLALSRYRHSYSRNHQYGRGCAQRGRPTAGDVIGHIRAWIEPWTVERIGGGGIPSQNCHMHQGVASDRSVRSAEGMLP
jgi:hypothetical protein